MIKKLFGETDEEQFRYLEPRILAMVVAIMAAGVGIILQMISMQAAELFYGLAAIIFYIDMLIFGWAIFRGLFGVASVGVLFSRNAVLTAIILAVYLGLGLYGGMIVAVIGLCRYFVLLKRRKGLKQEQE